EAPEGSLLIDGRPVREYPLAVLRRNIGIVPQETFLFSETIRENLAFGAPHADAEDLLEAAEAAHIRLEFEENVRCFRRLQQILGVGMRRAKGQVFANRLAEEKRLLRHYADIAPQDGQRILAHW